MIRTVLATTIITKPAITACTNSVEEPAIPTDPPTTSVHDRHLGIATRQAQVGVMTVATTMIATAQADPIDQQRMVMVAISTFATMLPQV